MFTLYKNKNRMRIWLKCWHFLSVFAFYDILVVSLRSQSSKTCPFCLLWW